MPQRTQRLTPEMPLPGLPRVPSSYASTSTSYAAGVASSLEENSHLHALYSSVAHVGPWNLHSREEGGLRPSRREVYNIVAYSKHRTLANTKNKARDFAKRSQ